MVFDKDLIKEELDLEDIMSLLEDLGAEPEDCGEYITAITVCHGGNSRKLWYYDNTKLFHCFTHCGDSFDIFELVQKVKEIDLNTAIYYIVNYFNLQHKIDWVEEENLSEDWRIFKNASNLKEIKFTNDKIELPMIDSSIIQHYPQPRIISWEKEFISKDVCDYMNIRYDPVNNGILIPHYDENGRMIGIRERTLIKENEKWGKYKPVKINKKLRNHPLGFNLYGLDKAKQHIKDMGIALVLESEKAVLQTMNYLGLENNIAVGMCGSSLSNYQLHLLLEAGAKEVCIGVDRDFKELYDEEYYKVLNKINKMHCKYSSLCNISFMLDVKGLTGYKMSPTDCGKEIFMELWKDRKWIGE